MITKIYGNTMTNNISCSNAKTKKAPAFAGIASIGCNDLEKCPGFFERCGAFAIKFVLSHGVTLSRTSGRSGTQGIVSITCSKSFDALLKSEVDKFAKKNGFEHSFKYD